MDNSRQRTAELIDRYLEGSATAEERAQLERWYADALLKSEYPDDLEIEQVNQLKKEGLMAAIAEIRREQAKPFTLWPKIRIAAGIAAAIATIVFGVWFFNHPSHSDTSGKSELVSVSQDIAPGRNGATITRANGQVIALDSSRSGVVVHGGLVRYASGSRSAGSDEGSEQHSTSPVDITSLKSGEQLVASTARGQTYQFTLPDGTKVWLNADSKISFPSHFNGAERKVLLSGEAYFAVVHNAKQPFTVESDAGDGKRQVVEDIGTEFNISAYADEQNIKTTLVAGSARVTDGNMSKILKPDQQVVNANGNLKVADTDTELATAWKNNKFIFDNSDIQYIMRQVARWYNVEVIYNDPPTEKFGGTVSRFDNISSVLKILQSTGLVKLRLEGKKLYVSK